MFMATHLIGFGGGGGAPVTLSFTASPGEPTNSTTYTFSAVSIGTPAADRQVVVAVANDGSTRTVSSVTVGGTGLSSIVSINSTSTVHIWAGTIAAGTTADIVVTLNAISDGLAIGVWAMTGAAVGASATGTSTASPGSVAIAVPASGAIIAMCEHDVNGANITWGGGITEDYDAGVDTNFGHSGASSITLGGTTPTITSTYASGAPAPGMIAASWAPA